MTRERLYRILDADADDRTARLFRMAHHATVVAGIAIMLAETVQDFQRAHAGPLDIAFRLVCAFFAVEYIFRLWAVAEQPGAEHRGEWRSRLAWAVSLGGVFDALGVAPLILLNAVGTEYASLFSFVWVFKIIRYVPALKSLERVILQARAALLSVLLGFGIVLLAAASLAYLFERQAQPKQFGSIPAALWWAVVTMTTTGYGDTVPVTVAGRMLAAVVMIGGILVFALWAGILATGYAEELRRREFLRTWDLVAQVPFFQHVGAAAIAEVTRLLRPRDYQAGAVIFRRGEIGDCMYFIASGEVKVLIEPEPPLLGPGNFVGELALLTGEPRGATIVTTRPSTLLTLDIVDFRELLGRQPELARIIHAEANARLEASAAADLAMAMDGSAC
jgi:voltage-gated potassium channel